MKFDLRLPIGVLFSVYGVILALYGMVGDKEQYARSLGINVNLIWGIVMLVFGAVMLFFARRGTKKSE
jgi:hypothetical protein